MIRSTDQAAIKAKMTELLTSPTQNLRSALSVWATAQGIETG
jgi:phosphotransferase system, enzyme I, PtsP